MTPNPTASKSAGNPKWPPSKTPNFDERHVWVRPIAKIVALAACGAFFDHLPYWDKSPVRSGWLPLIVFAVLASQLALKKRRSWEWFFVFPPLVATGAVLGMALHAASAFLTDFSADEFQLFRLYTCIFLTLTTLWIACFPYGRGFPGDESGHSRAWKRSLWVAGGLLAGANFMAIYLASTPRQGVPLLYYFFQVVIWGRRLGLASYALYCARTTLPLLLSRIHKLTGPVPSTPLTAQVR